LRGPRATIGLSAVALALGVAMLAAGPSSAARPGPVVRPGTGLSTNYDFARLVLADGHWPQSANNVMVLTQWMRAEEPVEHWWNRSNPLNNGLGSGGGSGLGSYRTLVTAAYFVARNLTDAAYGYPLVAHSLSTSPDPSATARAIWRSQWASGHYGFGADWSTVPVPSISAPASSWQSPTACPIAYPAGVLGPCGAGFAATGPAWHAGSPAGIRGEELWAFSGPTGAGSQATWAPSLAAGTYEVQAFVPSRFSDATVAYVVIDAKGGHRVVVDQEPFVNGWAPLGTYSATSPGGIRVHLALPVAGANGATYVAADAMRFVRVHAKGAPGATAGSARRAAPGTPGAPVSAAAVASDGAATVSWLAPSKDGGSRVLGYLVVSRPGGHGCVAVGHVSGTWTCTVHGLTNGTSYTFTIRARNHLGVGPASAASTPVRPLGVSTVHLLVAASPLVFGERAVLHAVLASPATGGTVLFFEDGRTIKGCQAARVVRGRAGCSLRFDTASRHVLLATFTGSTTLTGATADVALNVGRVRTSFHLASDPVQVTLGAAVTLRAWGLPGHATGRIVFSSDAGQLCVANAISGGGQCTAKLDLPVGVHVISGHYLGDRDFFSSVSQTSLQVNATVPTT